MPRTWTPEQRAELGAKIKAAHEARKANYENVVQKAEETSRSVEELEALNPIATDVVVTPRPRSGLLRRHVPESVSSLSTDASVHLLEMLAKLPVESLNYEECGLLLNALSKASTDIALVRRKRQEQVEAGTSRATCKTCGRTIDISRAGGFQILTERDEHHMPVNRYYCSQNCLLARNLPSHAKSTPKQKEVNRA